MDALGMFINIFTASNTEWNKNKLPVFLVIYSAVKFLLSDIYMNVSGQEVACSVVETGRPVNFFYHGEYRQWQLLFTSI